MDCMAEKGIKFKGLEHITTHQIHIEGIVQGVGFRPFIYNLAKQLNKRGWVANTSTGVYISINSNIEDCQKFLNSILNNLPSKAVVTSSTISIVDNEVFDNFTINNSFEVKRGKVFLPPDFALCDKCATELLDPKNRRYHYPFITCTNCGPRYSIIKALPYDRKTSTMHKYTMCKKCASEYNSTSEYRFYSQTNSCSDCGIRLSLYNGSIEKKGTYEDLIDQAVEMLSEGAIVAVKGIGGYLLLADASNSETISTLRKRKNRPSKPFALLVKDKIDLNKLVYIKNAELEAWKSKEAEIVLFKTKSEAREYIDLDKISPGLNKIGIMSPYAPILKIIVNNFGKTLIATSANLSGSPIIYKDDEAREHIFKLADIVLINDREILIPQDDSVVQFSEIGTRISLRRSRGIAPNYFGNPLDIDFDILAVGAFMKSTFSIYKNKQFYISQFLGNTDYIDSQDAYINTVKHLTRIINHNPKLIICDLHPDYFSTQFAEKLSDKKEIDIIKVQHHEAHFSAVIGENELLDKNILGFIWDGTGLGNDAAIWGSEVFELKNREITRLLHIKYQKHILGDKMVLEPRLSALSLFGSTKGSEDILAEKFNENELKIYSKAIKNSSLKTSSMGRLFDAVASILNLTDINKYEGEAAMLLESLAAKYPKSSDNLRAYNFEITNFEIDISDTKTSILRDIKDKLDKSEIAMRFHITMVNIINTIAKKQKIKDLAFSGGVFQNSLLINLIEKKLSKENNLYFHKQLSPNDECISFGQIIRYALMDNTKYTL